MQVVGNIRGADAATYLSLGSPSASPGASPGSSAPPVPPDDDPVRCSCGFSAVLNRRLAHNAGLFYEDEMEITGIAEDPAAASPNALPLAEVYIHIITKITLSPFSRPESNKQDIISNPKMYSKMRRVDR